MAHYAPWPEDPGPQEAQACSRCELAGYRKRVVWGEGDPHAPLMIILDNPGLREDSHGKPFVCGTRRTLQDALSEAGVSLERVYVTYLLKCRPTRKYDKPACRAVCRGFLERQIELIRPQCLLMMGDVVVQALLSPEFDVKSLRGTRLSFRGTPALATYHPLAARRRPGLNQILVEDIRRAASRLQPANP